MNRDFYENSIMPKGHINMTLFKGDCDLKSGKIEGEILKSFDDHNIIVNVASNFMAGRMTPSNINQITSQSTDANGNTTTESTTSSISSVHPLKFGFQCLALGNGKLNSFTSDTDKASYLYNPGQADTITLQSQIKLDNELIRKPFSSWSFLNTDGTLSNEETNILKLTTLFTEEDIPGEFIVEMGLFGGDATCASGLDGNTDYSIGKDTGHMFNYKLFPSWNKIEGSSLLINWIITF